MSDRLTGGHSYTRPSMHHSSKASPFVLTPFCPPTLDRMDDSYRKLNVLVPDIEFQNESSMIRFGYNALV